MRRRRLAIAASALGLVLLWMPAMVEQVTRTPGNLVAVTRFFRDTPPAFDRHPPLEEAAATVARQVSALPLGLDPAGQLDPTGGVRRLAGLAWLGLATGCIGLAWWRRSRFAAALGVVAALGGLVAVLAASRVTGALLAYLVFYATVLPVPVVIGFGVLALDGTGRSRVLVRAGALGCGLVLLATTWAAARSPLEPEPPSPEVEAGAGLAGNALGRAGVHRVILRQQRHEYWPVTMGLVLALERAGYEVAVDQNLVTLLGEAWAPDGRQEAELIVSGPPDATPEGRALGSTGALGLWLVEPG